MRGIYRLNAFVASVVIIFCTMSLQSQELLPGARVWGNFQMDAQYYQNDSGIRTDTVPEKIRMNAFLNLNVEYQGLTVGMRYESYQGPLLGFDPAYQGNGIPYRFASYRREGLEVTVGNFYEQYGNGLVLRSYVEPNLGLDNSIDGVRLNYQPVNGITLRTLIGQQRLFFDKGPGIVRGADAEFFLNQLLGGFSESRSQWTLGLSGVSKYQRDQDPQLNLPENVAAFAGRLNFVRGGFNLNTEYAYKINDPSADNNRIYRHGEALTLSTSYSFSGFGLLLSAKRIDNMGFRSSRNARGNDLHINYLPAMTRQHVYSLTGMYPYATQPTGEVGALAELTFRIPRQTMLGGAYGTTVVMNFSLANSIDKQPVNDTTAIGQRGTDGYTSDFFAIGDEKFFRDFNVEVSRRFSRELRGSFTYMNLFYNQNIIEGYSDREDVRAHIFVADMTYRLPQRRSLRWELQHLATQQDNGNWFMAMAEFNITPQWFVSVADQYNYGNDDTELRNHYYTASAGYTRNANRIAMSYGRQREGIICVGGVCRVVPASSGLTLNVTSSF
ncbi:MAG: hypothetical protein EA361_02985 [Bacteroidetes bacterium]|nr:MAG: hypothetical protein EA361_02985 [Bacteroidota bacterium]